MFAGTVTGPSAFITIPPPIGKVVKVTCDGVNGFPFTVSFENKVGIVVTTPPATGAGVSTTASTLGNTVTFVIAVSHIFGVATVQMV